MLEDRGLTAAQAIVFYSLIGPAQVVGRLCLFAVDRILPVSIAGMAGTLLPVLAMVMLMTLDTMSPLLFAFPILFGTGMGIKTVVQATAAPELLGKSAYGSLQGMILMPVFIAQAAAPFIAASIWQVSGEVSVLEEYLLAAAIVAAGSFVCAVGFARHQST